MTELSKTDQIDNIICEIRVRFFKKKHYVTIQKNLSLI